MQRQHAHQRQQGHQPEPNIHGRCMALFPGAFRPPHAAHLRAVLDLAARPNVDEVVVIVSNRCRCIPGTSKALDANIALRVWAIYLQTVAHEPGIDKVRVEAAPHTAVRHALDYFNRVNTSDSLLFCIGEKDRKHGDGRFDKLTDFSRRSGVAAEVIAAPTGCMAVRSTPLRKALAHGDDGRAAFMAALPTYLTAAQCAQVWLVCQQGMREIQDLIKNKVASILKRNGVGDIVELSAIGPIAAKLDSVFRARCQDGRVLFVKYAGDTVESAAPGQNAGAKPRRRLATERRTLKRLRTANTGIVCLPEVVLFDKPTRTLVLTEVCPGGRTLEEDLQKGVFESAPASVAANFLARCHTLDECGQPLWGDKETDRQQWQNRLALLTSPADSAAITPRLRKDLQALAVASNKASLEAGKGERILLLNYSPDHILVSENQIAVINFELGACVGDPAYDLGFYLGHYVLWGLRTSAVIACQTALRQALKTYRQEAEDLWPSISSRVAAFAGATLLHQVLHGSRTGFRCSEGRIMRNAAALLASGLHQHANSEQLLSHAVADVLV